MRGVYIHAASVGEAHGHFAWLRNLNLAYTGLTCVERSRNELFVCILSGKKKQHKHKLFGPDFPRTFLTLAPECPGVKKFLPTTGAAGKRTFWCGRPRFSARTSMTRRVVEKLCTKKVCIDFLAPILTERESCWSGFLVCYSWQGCR